MKRFNTLLSGLVAVLTLFLFSGNAITLAHEQQIGFSGMAWMGESRYLVVIDKKSHHQGPRLGIYQLHETQGPTFSPVSVSDWRHPHGQASDLESACKLPGTENEYLVAESGYWKGRNGRIFHLMESENTLSVKAVYSLPLYISNDEGTDGDNFEGMLCVLNENTTWVIMGERGGTKRYPQGVLRPGKLDKTMKSITWLSQDTAIRITPQGVWSGKQSFRSISDLHQDEQGTIWASATEDKGDLGPFNSLIYAAGKLKFGPKGISLWPVAKQQWQISGLKIESLSHPATLTPAAVMSIGSEDEDLGGVWRPLLP